MRDLQESWFGRAKRIENLVIEKHELEYKVSLMEEQIEKLTYKNERLHEDIRQLERDLSIAEFKNDFYEGKMKGAKK